MKEKTDLEHSIVMSSNVVTGVVRVKPGRGEQTLSMSCRCEKTKKQGKILFWFLFFFFAKVTKLHCGNVLDFKVHFFLALWIPYGYLNLSFVMACG